MLAFHNDKAVQKKYLARVQAHYKADEIIHGTYWDNGKGCAVGCTIHGSNHALYETELGIPQMLARLEDTIFEHLSNGKAKQWPLRFLKACKLGKDLSLVGWQFQHWLQLENLKNAEKQKMPADVIAAIRLCADVLVPLTKGLPVDEKAARSAESAWSAAWSARSAARSAESAWSAAWSARSAAWSARSAAWSAAWSARSAAWSARSAAESAWSARSAAESARSAAESARSAAWSAWEKMADKLIELLKAA